MAGIGWKLEKMLARDSLGATLQAYLAGVAITSAPWLLTTTVLVTLRIMTRDHATLELAAVEHLITIAYAVTLVLSAPVHVVVSRHVADRLYEKRLDLVGPPLRQALILTLFAFLAVGVATMVLVGVPTQLAVPGVMLTAIIAAQWLLLAIGGGMSSPARVLGAFAIGAAVSIAMAIGLERIADLGARGYLVGFTLGQAVALAGMLIQILRSLPAEESPAARGVLPAAFREYRLLAASALAVHAAVWVDKVATFALRGASAASMLASVSALAWFTLIPAFAWIYLQVETSFYRVFWSYFRGIETGASLVELEASAAAIRAEAGRLIRGAAVIQATVMGFGLLAAPHVVAVMGLPPGATLGLQLSLGAAALQVSTLLGLLLLYYLDLRYEAFLVALAQLAMVVVVAVVVLVAGAPPALGAALGSLLPAAYALAIVRRAMNTLTSVTFQSQPYAAEAPAPPRGTRPSSPHLDAILRRRTTASHPPRTS